jgi:hypothetical protein
MTDTTELTIYQANVDGGYQHIIAAHSPEQADEIARRHDEPETDTGVTVWPIACPDAVFVRVDDGQRVTLADLLALDPPRHPGVIASTCED